MKKSDKSMRTKPICYFASAMRKYKKGFYFIYAILILSMMVQPFISIIGPKMMIDGIMLKKDIEVIIRIAGVMVLADFVIKAVTVLTDLELDKEYYTGLDRHLEAAVGKKSMELKYETTENKETLDSLADARTGIDSGYSGGSRGLFGSMALLIINILKAD